MTEILVTGATGQLGQEFCQFLDENHIKYVGLSSDDLDITDENAVNSFFLKMKPAFVFHCAAFTAVDAAEDEKKDDNWNVNSIGTKHIAKATESVDATLVYISTDYVFDGTKINEYQTSDIVNPKNEYGKAKLAGEQAVQNFVSKFYIIRTSWVFGEFGKNFVYTMKRLATTHDHLTVVADQFGRPTWTRTLAEFMWHLKLTNSKYGIYHLSNEGSCSWFEFASEILKNEDITIKPVMSEEYPQKAYRPRHSIMSLEKAKETNFKIVTWQEALSTFLESTL